MDHDRQRQLTANQRTYSEIVGPVPADYLNFIRDPYDPFLADSTLDVSNVASFTNSGDGATWTPMDVPVDGVFNARANSRAH